MSVPKRELGNDEESTLAACLHGHRWHRRVWHAEADTCAFTG